MSSVGPTSDVLGLVPLVGRAPLTCSSFNGRVLFCRAVDVLARIAQPVVVVTDTAQTLRAEQGLDSVSANVDLAEVPRDDNDLRAFTAGAQIVVIHDPLCPLVSANSLRGLLQQHRDGTATVVVRPVVDTLKTATDGVVSGTVDRDTLRAITSPLVLPASLFADIPDLMAVLGDVSGLVRWLAERIDVRLVEGPQSSARIEDMSSLRLMASVDVVQRQLDRT